MILCSVFTVKFLLEGVRSHPRTPEEAPATSWWISTTDGIWTLWILTLSSSGKPSGELNYIWIILYLIFSLFVFTFFALLLFSQCCWFSAFLPGFRNWIRNHWYPKPLELIKKSTCIGCRLNWLHPDSPPWWLHKTGMPLPATQREKKDSYMRERKVATLPVLAERWLSWSQSNPMAAKTHGLICFLV